MPDLSHLTFAMFSTSASRKSEKVNRESPKNPTVVDTRQENYRVYQIRPLTPNFGVECVDVDLSKVNISDDAFVDQVKQDLLEHRVVLFRNQKNLSGQRQVDISNMLGKVQSTFYKHPKSPHPDIFRVSNNEEEGCTNVGRSGWHIDGTFQERPFRFQTMYFPSVMTNGGGDTYFVPLKELYDELSAEVKEIFNRLWMVTGHRHSSPIHPLVYDHPFRLDKTMMFHCGPPFVRTWLLEDASSDSSETLDKDWPSAHAVNSMKRVPAENIQNMLTQEINSRLDSIGLRMKWKQGDFMINDNLGLAHYASDGTQTDPATAGLRLLHRTTITGGPETVPQKEDGRQSFTIGEVL